MRIHGPLVLAIMLTASLAVTGCAGKVRVASAKMCQAHGGTYNASTKTCSYQASTRTAKQACEAQGGFYDIGADFCELGND